MKNVHILPTDNYAPLVHSTGRYGGYFKSEHYSPMKDMGDSYQHIYITSDEEIKEGDWYENNGVIFKADDVFDEGNNPNNSNPKVTYFNIKIILTTDQDLIKDGVQAIDDEFLQWFVKNPNCDEVKLEYRYNFYAGKYLTHYKIIIPKEEPTAYHYLSCCRSIEECHCGKYPKQIKCYCGHTTMCDCSPKDEAFGIIYVLETLLDFAGEGNATSISISTTDAVKIIKLLKQIK